MFNSMVSHLMKTKESDEMVRRFFLGLMVLLVLSLPSAVQATELLLPFDIPFETSYDDLVILFEEAHGIELVPDYDIDTRLTTPEEVFIDWEGIPASVVFRFSEDRSNIEYVSIYLSEEVFPLIVFLDKEEKKEELHRQLTFLSGLFDTLDSRWGVADISVLQVSKYYTFIMDEEKVITLQFPVIGGGMDIEKVFATFLDYEFGRIGKLYSNVVIVAEFGFLRSGLAEKAFIRYLSSIPSDD